MYSLTNIACCKKKDHPLAWSCHQDCLMLLFVFFVCLVFGVFVLPFLTVCETFDLILDTVIASSKTSVLGMKTGVLYRVLP